MKAGARNNDMRMLLWLTGAAVLLILIVSFLIPKHENNDPRPRTDNNGSAGAKAAFLLLPKLGYKVGVWDSPEEELERVDASKTTLVLASVYVDPKQVQPTAEAVKRFLERGGRVLVTGNPVLLPNGKSTAAAANHPDLCYTTAEGQGVLAQAGQVSMRDEGAWDEHESKLGPALHVEQRCDDDAVVVSYAVGKGEAIWWSSSLPLSYSGLHDDASLRLLLASVGEPGRTVLFDEFAHGREIGLWDSAKGLPIKWLLAQFVLIALLLILSFSRRSGPLRMPVSVPRTSPVEFATSMGHLYERAGATNAATGTARRRLLRFLQAECGVARVTIDAGPAAIAEALHERFGGDWNGLSTHLADAAEAESKELAPKSALRLVQALDAEEERLRGILAPKSAASTRETISKEDSAVQNAELVSAIKE
jgi:hypothetical protein